MPPSPPSPRAFLAAVAALACYLAGLGWAGAAIVAALPDYAHATTPMATLAVRGLPGAVWFNAAMVATGSLAAAASASLRGRLAPSAPWSARIGARLLLLAALAFALQGLLPLDPDDLDGPGAALRGVAWTLWWPALALGAALLAAPQLAAGMRRTENALSVIALCVAAAGFPLAAMWSVGWMGALPDAAPYLPERLLPAVWLLWLCLLVQPYAAGDAPA